MDIWEAVERVGMKESVITAEQWERIATVRNELGTRVRRGLLRGRYDAVTEPLAFHEGAYSPYGSGTIQYGTLLHAPLTRQSILYGLTSIDDE